ncbi:MAG: hypothetical protein ACTSR8_16720 [Promethearchaeota archaeon]
MRRRSKNKLMLTTVIALIIPVLAISVILPRTTFLTALMGNEKVKTEVYDVFFCDYSKDEDTGLYMITMKVLLDVRNGDTTQKLIIPRIRMDLNYLDKPVGKIWTIDEFILEPFISDESDSAGLLPMYISLYLDEDESGIEEFINGMIMGELDPIEANLIIYLGDAPITLNILLGELFSLFQSEEGGDTTAGFDIFGTLGFDLGGSEKYRIPDDYIFLKKDDNVKDLRSLFSIDNMSIFLNKYESLIFGANDKFTEITWENGSINNQAVGDGDYQWQYYDGDSWENFSIDSDGTNKFTKTGKIVFSAPSGWNKGELVDFFPEYYYIACKVKTLDSGENITMNVEESFINDYNALGKAGLSVSGKIKPQADNSKIEYPDLEESELPLDKGLIKGLEELDLEDYFVANGLNYTYIMDDILVASFLRGLAKLYTTEWIAETEVDGFEDLSKIEVVLEKVTDFTSSHGIDFMEYLLLCEFDFLGIFQYIGENFEGFTAPDGIDLLTGENIYAPLEESSRYFSTILFSYALFIVLLVGLAFVTPYYASKRVDQSFIFDDIKNLDIYISEIRREMEKGITEDEIKLLKTAVFRKTDISEKLRKKNIGGDKKK